MNGPSGTFMGGGLCGKQIEIVAVDTGRSIVIPVIDACEACNADDHVDLTLAVWQELGLNTCAGTSGRSGDSSTEVTPETTDRRGPGGCAGWKRSPAPRLRCRCKLSIPWSSPPWP
jgi:hypothetical protein